MMRNGILLFITQFILFILVIGPVYSLMAARDWPSKFSDLFSYFDLPSLVIVLTVFVILGMGNGVKDFFLSFSRLRKRIKDPADIRKSLAGVQALKRMVVNWSVVGTLIGAVIMLTNLDDTSVISRGFGAAFLTIFYALVFILIFCLPMEIRLKLRLAEMEGNTGC